MSDLTQASAVRICGIGASAGGIEALRQLFGALPPDLGLAYVVILHLSPDFKSELPSILSRTTSMPVVQVADREVKRLEPDHVYVIAPDRKLEISDGSIAASEFDRRQDRRAAIDLFFRSLAAASGDAFAVILSGSGSDGALGARTVKEHGGLVLVQDPSEAAHNSMPRAVIATGAADLVLPIAEIATRLGALTKAKATVNPRLLIEEPPDDLPQDEARALRLLLDVVHERTGHDFSRYKRATLLRRMTRRMQLAQQGTIAEYLRYVRAQADEPRALFNDLLISVTTFFRDPLAWVALSERVIGPLIESGHAGDSIRAWVAGCATGEEAYSLAILFDEELRRRDASRNLIVFASDLDEAALAVGRQGLYSHATLVDVSEARLEHYFRPEEGQFRVVRDIRDRVTFAAHSILRDPPFSRINLISCRNVLIYFDRDLQDQAMGVFRYACRDGGSLFLGASESVDEDLFRTVDRKHRIFVARPNPQGVRHTLPPAFTVAGARGGFDAPRHETRGTPVEIHLSALEDMSPPSVVLDERGTVIHLSASASTYFGQGAGPLARRITELVRVELRDELASLLYRVATGAGPQSSAFVSLAVDGRSHRVAMVCQRRERPGGADVLLTFLDAGDVPDEGAHDLQRAGEGSRDLREELRLAEQRVEIIRDEQYLTHEELRAANEELQSLNEEYRSTTEELETSKEELQSLNEELQTVNTELELKLEDVSRANSDLENLMAATNVATLFLSRDLRIKRYTPQLEQLFNVRTRDHDRPIADLTHQLTYTTLEADAASVIATGVAISRETESRDGRVYVVRLSPYRSSTQALDGVVATFIEVTEFKRIERALRDSERRLESELNVMRRLHTMAIQVATSPTVHDSLQHLLTAAIDLHGAEFGTVQLLNKSTQRMEIIAQKGFGLPFLERLSDLDADDASAGSRALRSQHVVQVSDVQADEHYESLRRAAAQAGFRAVQATPLINRNGIGLGALSVHFHEPHVFTERDMQIAALLGRQAAELIESRLQQLEVSESKLTTTAVRQLLARLVRVQEEERRRIARDIHDQMGQQMTALRMSLDAAQRGASAMPEVADLVTRATRLADDLDHSIDFLTWELRPAGLELLELTNALADLVRNWSERFGIEAEYECIGGQAKLPLDVTVNLYRVTQEALHNIYKHAGATHVRVMIEIRSTAVMLTIEDDGRGFEVPPPTSTHGGVGLVGMRERALLIGGELQIESTPGSGTTVFVRVPLTAGADKSGAPAPLS
jgi:two-component system CheB/CheR fusion protein